MNRHDQLSSNLDFKEHGQHHLYVHDELWFDLFDGKTLPKPIYKRVNLCLDHLAAFGRTSAVKSVKGNLNKGWRRSPLGGGSGNHYYLWWAPTGAPPVQSIDGKKPSIFIRAVRHHDEHGQLKGDGENEYHKFNIKEIRELLDSHHSFWTDDQESFVRSHHPLRLLQGYPGSGKTKALFRAVNTRSGENVLFLTWSRQLTEMAMDYFATFAPIDSEVLCLDFQDFQGRFIGRCVARDFFGYRTEFVENISKLSPEQLGAWTSHKSLLYDEIRSHLIGSSLPTAPDNLEQPDRPRLKSQIYLKNRKPHLGEAADQVCRIVNAIENAKPIENYFPDLLNSWFAASELLLNKTLPDNLPDPDRIVVDEVQDLTSLESLVVCLFSKRVAKRRKNKVLPFMLFAGDEGQTVRPTGFDWGNFKQLLLNELNVKTEESLLRSNLRCPVKIATLVNQSKKLYKSIDKDRRPDNLAEVEINESISDTVIHGVVHEKSELDKIFKWFSERESTAIIEMDDYASDLAGEFADLISTPEQVKGRDFQTVCIVNVCNYLEKLAAEDDLVKKSTKVEPLWKRTDIDRLRVSISRACDTLVFLDFDPSPEGKQMTEDFLFPVDYLAFNYEELLEHLESEEIDQEDRVSRLIKDSEKLLESNPAIALRKAEQAVAHLGVPNRPGGIDDISVRNEAHMNLARTAFLVACHPSREEFSDSQLFAMAEKEAISANDQILPDLIGSLITTGDRSRKNYFADLINHIERFSNLDSVPSWVKVGLRGKYPQWTEDLLKVASNPDYSLRVLGNLDVHLATLEWPKKKIKAKVEETKRKAAESLFQGGNYKIAIEVVNQFAEIDPHLLARCHEGLKNFKEAAQFFEKAGKYKKALDNFREIADIQNAKRILGYVEEYDDSDVVEWLSLLDDVLKETPLELRSRITKKERSTMDATLKKVGRT